MGIRHADLAATEFSDIDSGQRIPRPSPGDILKLDFMAPAGLSAYALAKAAGVPANRITAIINRTRGITADTALRLAAYFGNSAEFWMNLQMHYDLDVARARMAA